MLLVVSICCAAYLVLLGTKCLLAMVLVRDDGPADELPLEPGTLTILQPILSGDARLEQMLESNLRSLPGQRFLWLCDGWDQEGIRVAEHLRSKYPLHAIFIRLCADCPERVNPKVFKLIDGAGEVTTPFFAVLDDDTHLPSATAADLVRHAGQAMVATALPSYLGAGCFSGGLLAQFVNNNSAVTYLSLLPFCRPISLNGMCYVMKTADIGIFRKISHHLTDDLALAGAVKDSGGGIHQSSRPVSLTTDITGFPHYLRMMHRWYLFALLLMKEQKPGYKAVILALHGWHPLVLWVGLVGLMIAPSLWMLGIVAGFLLLRSWLLRILQKEIFGKSIHRPLASIVSEMLQPFHLLHAAFNRNIRWRSRRYRVFSSERFEAYE